MSLRSNFCIAALLCLGLQVAANACHAADMALVQFPVKGTVATGLSLARDASTWLILGTDGQLHYLDNAAAFREVTPIPGEFAPTTASELRTKLSREFGPAFEVAVTKHFLVVQPRGRGTKWPDTFEQLHRQFTHQLKMRGVDIRTGKFPMVAIVLPDRAALHAMLVKQNIPSGMIAGVYIANTNRVYTYEGSDAAQTLAVLRHEASHQSAFNSNVHSRLNVTPKWITEGLGMMFEPPAMADGRPSTLTQRMHQDAIALLKQRYADSHHSMIADIRRLITHDTMFEQASEVRFAYSMSWLMMFYLSERRPKAFAEFLNFTSSRPPFVEYSPANRLRDFQRITGISVEQFANEAAALIQ